MITKRKFHIVIAILCFLSFFAPVKTEESTQLAAEYFLITGSVINAFVYIPAIIEPIRIIEEPRLIAEKGLLFDAILFSIFSIGVILYFYAILLLLLWSLFFLTYNLRTMQMFYRFWLLISLASSIILSVIPFFTSRSGLGFWLNPFLLLFATIGEFWVFKKVER